MKIGVTELIIIFVVALIAIGPDKLPEYARKLGEALAQFRKFSSEATKEIQESVVEPLEEAQRPLKEAMEPIEELDQSVRRDVNEVHRSLNNIGKDTAKKTTKATVAEREAAVAAKEAELAEKEARLAAREAAALSAAAAAQTGKAVQPPAGESSAAESIPSDPVTETGKDEKSAGAAEPVAVNDTVTAGGIAESAAQEEQAKEAKSVPAQDGPVREEQENRETQTPAHRTKEAQEA